MSSLEEAYFDRYKLDLRKVLDLYSDEESSAYIDGLTAGLELAIDVAARMFEKECVK